VIAVEPIDAMRATLERVAPDIRVLDGTAEHLGLEASSADAIAVAQAFHWFANADALAEFHRVLRPAGRLALIWNRRSVDDPLQQGALGDHRTPPRRRADRLQRRLEARLRGDELLRRAGRVLGADLAGARRRRGHRPRGLDERDRRAR
jgi:SAM-dependent methyltransferase